MAIVPSGKARIMVAQSFASPFFEGANNSSPDNSASPITSSPIEGRNLGEVDETPLDENSIPKKEEKRTLTSYIFEKLESFGYPGRRLQEFKSSFVKESVSPDGVKNIEVVIPDKKYPGMDGKTDTIENEDLKEFANEIKEQFSLNFNGAERSGGKWNIKFTSADTSIEENPEGIVNDNLEQVYGKPQDTSKKTDKKSVKKGFSLQEMINSKKEEMVKFFMNKKSGVKK